MERHANFALVGALSTLLLVATVIFVVWLGGSQFNRDMDRYRIIFHGPLRGLSVGAEVQFNGIKMGQIDRIRLDEKDPNKVITDISLQRGTPVRTDSMASTETQVISGTSIVQISAGTPGHPLLRKTVRSKSPVIQSKPNSLASLIQGGGQMVENATQALIQVNKLLSDDNINNLGASIRDIRASTAALAENRDMFRHTASLLRKLDDAADEIQGAAASVRGLADNDGKRALTNIADAADELKTTVTQARASISQIEQRSAEIGSTTLPNISAAMESLQGTAESLDGLIRQIRRAPRQTLTKDNGKELELPQ